MRGIDVSVHNGVIDFKKVKESGIDFVIIRAGYGRADVNKNQVDKTFETNYANAVKNGLRVGAYWYTYAITVDEMIKESNAFLNVIKGKEFTMPIFIDIEEQKQFATGKANCTAMVKAFCENCEKKGYFTGVYISESQLKTYLDTSIPDRFALWVANWSSGKCHSKAQIRQYSSTGKINGINGNVDLNEAYNDFKTLIKPVAIAENKKDKLTITVSYKGKVQSYDFDII